MGQIETAYIADGIADRQAAHPIPITGDLAANHNASPTTKKKVAAAAAAMPLTAALPGYLFKNNWRCI